MEAENHLNVVKYGTTQYYVTSCFLPGTSPGTIFLIRNELIKHEVNGYKTDVSNKPRFIV